MIEVPGALEAALDRAARTVVGDAPLATPALVRAIVDRSERYTSERERLAVTDAGDLAARAVFFTPTDAMKITIPLGELARRDALPDAPRVVDLGAGCGAMTLGLSTVRAAQVVAIDRDAKALAIAAAAVRDFAPHMTFATKVADVTKVEIPACDLVVMGTVLNELADGLPLVTRALAAIGEAGAVIVIEPALRTTSRALHAIRDAFVEHVFAPCTRRLAPCTALADPDDWCHEDRAVTLPPRTAELARLTHLRDGGMKFSYLVLRKPALALVDVPAWRIVSAPRIAKGKHELIGCSDRGRATLRLLKRNRTPENRELERAERGDIVIASDVPGSDRVEIVGPIERVT